MVPHVYPKRRERSNQNYCIDSNQISLNDENQQVQVGLPTHHELHTDCGGQSSSLSSNMELFRALRLYETSNRSAL